MAFGAGGIILQSTDAGSTWEAPRTSGVTVDLFGAYFFDTANGIAVGSGGIIIQTQDGEKHGSLFPLRRRMICEISNLSINSRLDYR